jgi:hypothetical protein
MSLEDRQKHRKRTWGLKIANKACKAKKKKLVWLIPVLLVTQEAEIRRITV